MLAILTSMFLVGLATSVHCVSMCGPMVVTYAVKGDDARGWRGRVTPNLAYQSAKLLSYVLVGLALGAVGSALDLSSVRPWAMLAAGLYMLVLGLGMTGKAAWAARLQPRPPKALVRALTTLRRRSKASDDGGDYATPVAFGLLTGLMPCAPLMAAEIAAAGSGTPLLGGLTMLAFGLGTMPLLLAFGLAAGMIPARWKSRMSLVLAFVVMAMGIVFLDRAALLTGFPLNSGTVFGSPARAVWFAVFSAAAAGIVALVRNLLSTPSSNSRS